MTRIRATDPIEAAGLELQAIAFFVGLIGCVTGSVAAVLFAGLLYWMGRDAEREIAKEKGPRWQ